MNWEFVIIHLFNLILQALEKAKEAGRKERVLVRQREQLAMGDQINLDLTYSVWEWFYYAYHVHIVIVILQYMNLGW